jgi:hypothetical protein
MRLERARFQPEQFGGAACPVRLAFQNGPDVIALDFGQPHTACARRARGGSTTSLGPIT